MGLLCCFFSKERSWPVGPQKWPSSHTWPDRYSKHLLDNSTRYPFVLQVSKQLWDDQKSLLFHLLSIDFLFLFPALRTGDTLVWWSHCLGWVLPDLSPALKKANGEGEKVGVRVPEGENQNGWVWGVEQEQVSMAPRKDEGCVQQKAQVLQKPPAEYKGFF